MTTITDTKIISLNSEDGIALNNSYLSRIRFDLPNLIKDDKTVIHRQISVLNAQIPFSFYNVNSYYNTFTLKFGGSPVPITIPEGNYNSTNLFSTLSTYIKNLTTYTFTFSISNITGIVTIQSVTNFSVSSSGTMNKLLGLSQTADTTSTLISGNYTAVGIYPLNLLGTKKLQLRSGILSMGNYSSNNGGLNTLLLTIPVNASPFGMIDYTSISNSLISFSNTNLDEIDISITDAEDNNPIDFHNQNWTLTLAIYEYKKLIDAPVADLETSTTQLLKQTEIPKPEKPKKAIDPILEFLQK